MHQSRYVRLTFALRIAALVALFGGAPLQAQDPTRGTFIAIPDGFPQIDARAIVIRERGRDVVVLRSTEATPEALAMSLLVLDQARDRDPTPSSGEMIPITGFVYTSDLRGRDRQRLDRVLDRLRDRSVTDIGSLGSGRWIRYRSR